MGERTDASRASAEAGQRAVRRARRRAAGWGLAWAAERAGERAGQTDSLVGCWMACHGADWKDSGLADGKGGCGADEWADWRAIGWAGWRAGGWAVGRAVRTDGPWDGPRAAEKAERKGDGGAGAMGSEDKAGRKADWLVEESAD